MERIELQLYVSGDWVVVAVGEQGRKLHNSNNLVSEI